ncbi:MAG: CHAT domain-containing protein [Synechococcus sp.]
MTPFVPNPRASWRDLTTAHHLADGGLFLDRLKAIQTFAIACLIPICCLFLLSSPAGAQPSQQLLGQAAEQLELQGKQLAENRDFEAAAAQLEQAVTLYRDRNDPTGEAIALSNLAAIYGRSGNWEAADTAIANSLQLLPSTPTKVGDQQLRAQVLEIQGRLYFDRTQLQPAMDSWEAARALFTQADDLAGSIRIRTSQAKVLQALGFISRASSQLQQLVEELEPTPNTLLKATSLRSLGDTLLLTGNTKNALEVLERSLAVAEELDSTSAIAATRLSLGNGRRSAGDDEQALEEYAWVVQQASNPTLKLQAQLNRMDLLLAAERWQPLQEQLAPLQAEIVHLAPSRIAIQARLKLLDLFTKLSMTQPALAPSTIEIDNWAIATRQQAQFLGNRRAEAQALGLLGHLYEQAQQWQEAIQLTDTAILLAQTDRAFESLYQWQWQSGRIRAALGDIEGAIAAYRATVDTLDRLRGDLAAAHSDIQFAFRDSIEPIHRQLVDLLLSNPRGDSQNWEGQEEVTQDRLDLARQTVERLQLAELDNFFRAACIKGVPVVIDEVDAQAAVIYPIVLNDRLEILLRLPGQPLRQITVEVSSDEINRGVDRTRLAFGQRTSPRYLPLAQQLYHWLIQPIEQDLADSGVDTLVFVPDGVLRNLPMGALHDGEHYLLEQYAIAVSPGLQLLPPQPNQADREQILTAGLSQPRGGFAALPYVADEINGIEKNLSGRILANQDFTQKSLQTEMNNDRFSFVHIATHGQFSSQLDRTFLLAWDGNIDINQLRYLLLSSDFSRDRPVDLLVLSACETAMGDRQAALGLAGMATRSGARSTVATLWQVNDLATAQIVDRFYDNLVNHGMTKAKALQQAQLSVYENVGTAQKHPYYWASFVLVGNWQ